MSDMDEESLNDDNMGSKERSYTIDDVLQRVTTDIQQTEHIMATNKTDIEMKRQKTGNGNEPTSE